MEETNREIQPREIQPRGEIQDIDETQAIEETQAVEGTNDFDDPEIIYGADEIGSDEQELMGYPSYYDTINQTLAVTKYVSLVVIVVIALILVWKKVIKKQDVSKKMIITLSIVGVLAIILFLVSLFVKMPV